MWRTLAEFLNNLEKQKIAFAKSHGNFIYILALSSSESPVDGTEAASAVLAEVCSASNSSIYIEARPHQRAWLRSHGFFDIMSYQPRKTGAPMLHIMARPPIAPRQPSPVRSRGARPPP